MTRLARFARPGTAGGGEGDSDIGADAPLRRFLGPRSGPVPGEACELCSAPMGDDHRHVVDLAERTIMCTCRPCGVLFTGGAEAHEHFRTVPDRYLRVDPFELSAEQWTALQIPVGVAFVVDNTRLGETVAFYPSPGGATESELDDVSWAAIVTANPALADVEPDVEAVLLRAEKGSEPTCHVVPVDRCYELVGTMRLLWHGFDGGHEVRAAITDFFSDVDGRVRPAHRRIVDGSRR